MAFKLNVADLAFVLKQIKIGEANANGAALMEVRLHPNGDVITAADQYDPETGLYIGGLIGGVEPVRAIPDVQTPFGIRTVDGTYNNLVAGRELWGSAGQGMPRLLDGGAYLNEADGDRVVFGPNASVSNNNYAPGGSVADADPRIISNLVSDMSLNNPAAIVAALAFVGDEDAYGTLADIQAGSATWSADLAVLRDPTSTPAEKATAQGNVNTFLSQFGIEVDDTGSLLVPNIAPDEGLSAPFNSWMTFFGQFFDHGLDLITKGGAGTVYIPLQPDDPLYVPGGSTNFMVLTRSSNVNGPDGPTQVNVTTSWVDQNQTYTSHASHQVFLREYEREGGTTIATGKLLDGIYDGARNGLPTWADIKDQALDMLGIRLEDRDVGSVPLLRTDAYGNFIPGANGYAQLIVGVGDDGTPNTDDDLVVEGTAAGIVPTAVGAVRTPNAFLDDIAHNAVPVGVYDHDGNPGTAMIAIEADTDTLTGNAIATDSRGNRVAYDDELLDRHFITGDGRGNENIGLTAVHHVFHSEHNRQVELQKKTILESGDLDFINEWLREPVGSLADINSPAEIAALEWDGERLFQAAKMSTEMQYQHLVFEEFGRKIQPAIDPFVFNSVTDIDPSIFAEFANVVYRFGHSMLTDNMPRVFVDANGNVTGQDDMGLIASFLNPVAFNDDGTLTAEQAAGAVVRGMVTERGNEIDEFVTGAVRNNLLGIPLDLAAINIARGRDTNMPTLNEAREQLYAATGSTFLTPYESWADFAANLKNPMSVINFLAAYGKHDSITAQVEDSLLVTPTNPLGLRDKTDEERRDAAELLVFGGAGAPTDRIAFLNSTGAYTAANNGLNDIDLWIGGLAEKKMPFGGFLGSTFNAVFEAQMESLQDGDRFYYLTRTQGQNFLVELEENSFAKMIMANTDMSQPGADGIRGTDDDVIVRHMGVDSFAVYDYIYEVNAANQRDYDPDNISASGVDPVDNDPVLQALGMGRVVRDDPGTDAVETTYFRTFGGEHVVVGGTSGNDTIITDFGDDGIWGGAGDDRIESGAGVDLVNGGAGNDIITDSGDTGDFLKGDAGDDVIANSNGLDVIMGGEGNDVVFVGVDDTEVFGGEGDDFILGGDGVDLLMGNEGNDWIEGGGGFDTTAGDNSELFFNSKIIGHDVMFAGSEEHDFDAESGDDIMVQGPSVMRSEGMLGFDWSIHKSNPEAADSDLTKPIFTTDEEDILRDRFDAVEALSGWIYDDDLKGDNRGDVNDAAGGLAGAENTMIGHELSQAGVNRIDGLRAVLGDWATAPTGGDLESQIAFDRGNILMGGAGSDVIEGRGGDDIIDGDRWLNVRIRLTDPGEANTAANQIATVDSLQHIFAGDHAIPEWRGKTLFELMIDRVIVPSQMHIVREVLTDDGAGDDDVAVFWDVQENYTFNKNADGSYTVSHAGFDPANRPPGTNFVSDGVDKLWNIETLRFSDGAGGTVDVALAGLFGSPATGAPTINDQTPTEGQTLTASPQGISDADGIASAASFQWQMSSDGGATWTNVYDNAALTSDATFVPNAGLAGVPSQIGNILRVAVSFTDGRGDLETVYSSPTAVVGDQWSAVQSQSNTFNGTAGDDIAVGADNGSGLNTADTLNGNGGDDSLSGLGGNDILTGGAGNDTLLGGGATDQANYAGNIANFAFSSNGTNNPVVIDLTGAEGTDTLNSIERLGFGPAQYRVVMGTTGNDVALNGPGGVSTSQQAVFGLAGDDSVNGNSRADLLIGGQGNDTIRGGGGNDIIYWNVGDGRDVINGDSAAANIAGTVDTIRIVGDATAETYRIYSRTEALAAGITGLNVDTEIVITRNGTNNASVVAELNNIEEIRIDGRGGGDTFVPIGTFAGTSLLTSTITLNGSEGDDTVDITALDSAHRVVFKSNGGRDTIIGVLRAQDVIELPEGAQIGDYTVTTGADGFTTLESATHSVRFLSDGLPAVVEFGQAAALVAEEDVVAEPVVPVVVTPPVVVAPPTVVTPPAVVAPPAENSGSSANDVLNGGSGNDTINAGSGNDQVDGGAGDDVLSGGSGDDRLVGGSGDDSLSGGSGDDVVTGGDGDDVLHGGSGDDVLDGGAGDDVLTGGSGDDVFMFGDEDQVLDFRVGEDRVDLAGRGVTAATFATAVTIVDAGSDSLVTIGGETMLLKGVDSEDLDSGSFVFASGASSALATPSLSETVALPDSGPASDLFLSSAMVGALRHQMDRPIEQNDLLDSAMTGIARHERAYLSSDGAILKPDVHEQIVNKDWVDDYYLI